MPSASKLASLAAVAALGCATPGHAAGPWISETGGADMGMAGAGRAATAFDAAVISTNPAAMASLAGDTVTVAAMPLKLEYDYRGSAATPGRAENHEGVTTLPAAYAAHHGERLSYGIGAYCGNGLSLDSGNQWDGRRAVERSGIATMNIGPAVAWSIDDRFALGAMIAAQWASPDLRLAVANDAIYYGPPVGLPDGQLKVSRDSWSMAGQLGLTYQPRAGTRIGATWTAPVDHSGAVDVDASHVHPVLAMLLPADGAARLEFTLPQQVLIGAAHELRPDTLIAFGAAWQDWSELGDARFKLAGNSSPLFPAGLQDTWGASLGARHAFGPHWAASTGINYESSPATDRGVPAYFPVAEQWKLAAGIERSFGESLTVRGALSVILQGDARIAQSQHPLPLPGIPQFTGRYVDTRVYLLGLAADFRL